MMMQQPCVYPPAVPNPMMEKVAVTVSFAVMIAMNFALAGGQFANTIAPTYLDPDALTFAVWPVIYLLYLVLVVVQCMTDFQVEEILSRTCVVTGLNVRWRLVAAFSLNWIWLPVFERQLFGIALIIIATYLSVLLSLYYSMNPNRMYSFYQVCALSAPISANTAWLLVATCLNLFIVLGVNGWVDEYGVYGSPLAAIIVALASMSIAQLVAMVSFDFMWPAVAAWALAGINRMQTIPDAERFPVEAMNARLAQAAFLAMIVCALFAVGAFIGSVMTMCFPRGENAFKALPPM
eukprot:CAMPEP_0170276736 /NCGR_PEP_ID=MMETSP0116_2-20130129/38354_1 /TAXON_ID=400756 /ORGANISM="Durinskia baltica, Strain CSIRO CS-38" /LENGTH=292 /DNA_ID=CAMNT_0010528011 /DNA_START=29 /DNA_END=907 /DNA_ORIENTATION=+